MFLSIVATILVFCVSDTNSANGPICNIGVQYKFRGCPLEEGLTETPIKEISVNADSVCIRECFKHPDCKSVSVVFESALSTTRRCKLFTGHDGCRDPQSNSGYGYKIESLTTSIANAQDVRAAISVGDNDYALFFDIGMQKFTLTNQTLKASSAPMLLTDYFIDWSGVPQAIIYEKTLFPNVLYLVKDGMVEKYETTTTNATLSVSSSWPQSVAQFLGEGIPDDVTINAAFAKGDRIFTCTSNNLYISEYQGQSGYNLVEVQPGITNPKFKWSDVTAAAMDTDTDVVILFTGSTYFLQNVTDGTAIGSGIVCNDV